MSKTLRKKLQVILSLALILSFVTSAFAVENINDNTTPNLTTNKDYNIKNIEAGQYKEATNTFTDGSAKYYLITQDPSKSSATTVTYKGATHTLSGVAVGSDLNTMKVAGDTLPVAHYQQVGDRTYFIDDGLYTQSNPINYTDLVHPNTSYVGLNKEANGDPKAVITKAAYPDSASPRIAGTIERYNIGQPNMYFENLIFDGQGKDMAPLGPFTGIIGKNRGEYFFSFHGNSQGAVIRDVIIRNVGATNTEDDYMSDTWFSRDTKKIRKNVAMNFYNSTGQHNIEDVKFINIKTKEGFGIISQNQSSGNYFRNITIDGSKAHNNASSIKVEVAGNKETVHPLNANNIFLDGDIVLTDAANKNNVYVQDYRYHNVNLPSDFNYVSYRTNNGDDYSAAGKAYKTLPEVSSGYAILDIKNNTWIVQEGQTVTVDRQIQDVLTTIKNGNMSGTTDVNLPPPTIKLVVADGDIDSFKVTYGGWSAYNLLNGTPIQVVAVNNVTDPIDGAVKIPVKAGATFGLETANNPVVLYNFDFHTNAKYTLHEAIEGIAGNAALTDPNEAVKPFAGYPYYDTYKPAAAVSAKVTLSGGALIVPANYKDTFKNCTFTALASEITTEQVATIGVGDSKDLSGKITKSYTATVLTGTDNADDTTIEYYSTDTAVATVDIMGLVTAVAPGNASIYAKAKDLNNNGEIEKPWAVTKVTVKAKITFEPTTKGTGPDGTSNAITTFPDHLGKVTPPVVTPVALPDPATRTFTGWTSDKDLVKTDGTTIAAGTLITTADFDLINFTSNATLTGQYKEVTKATGTKTWVKGPTDKPTVWFKLYRSTEGGATAEVPGATVAQLDSGVTTYTWSDLDYAAANGNVYTYSVAEGKMENGTFVDGSPTNYIKVESGMNVTNTYQSPLHGTVVGTKNWVGGKADRPTVAFKLYRSITGGQPIEVPDVTPIEIVSGQNTATWTNLPETDDLGNIYTYSVVEGTLAGGVFTAGQPENYTKSEVGLVVTNKYQSPVAPITGNLVWVNGPATKPTVTLQLMRTVAGGDPVAVENADLKTLPNGQLSGTWADMPVNDNDGNPYQYSIVEGTINGSDFVPGAPANYTATYDGLTVTNTWSKESIAIVDPPVEKQITGDKPSENATFTFKMTALDNAPFYDNQMGGEKIATVQGSGSVEFGNFPISTEGTYRYTISEVKDSAKGYTYDDTIYNIVVKVTRNPDTWDLVAERQIFKGPEASGQLVDKAIFTNNYKVDPVPVDPTKGDPGTVDPASPKTGDTNNLPLFMTIVMTLSLITLAGVRFSKKS